jgi:HlyD family secretion protein
MNSSRFRILLRRSVIWLLVVILVGFAVYRVKFAPVAVRTHEVHSGPIVAEVMGTGTLEARVRTTLSPRLQERLAEVLVDQGDTVKAGQLLARLDDGELRRQVEVSAAAIGSTQATAQRVQVDETRAEAVEQQARQNYERVVDLVSQEVSPQSELDKALELLRVAETDLQRARAATVEAQQQVLTAEKTLAYHQERLAFAQLISPYDGLIIRRDRDPGGVVVPGSSLLQLVSTNELWVSAWVDETAASTLAPGQPARVIFRAKPEMEYPGEVARLGRETDRETREFLVDVRVRQLPPNWTIGQRAEVFIETKREPDALIVPQRFIQWNAGQAGVWVVRDGRVIWRDVTLGLRGRETVEIQEGLSDGETVAVHAGRKPTTLMSGQRIDRQ